MVYMAGICENILGYFKGRLSFGKASWGWGSDLVLAAAYDRARENQKCSVFNRD